MNNKNNKSNYDENNYESDENNKENNVLRRARSETRVPDAPSEQESPVASAPLLSPACLKIREDLKASLDGQLGWWRQQAVTKHIAHCIACREEREAMREFSERLRQSEFEQAGSQQERSQQNLSQAASLGQQYGRNNFARGGLGNTDVLDPALRARILAAVPAAPPVSPVMGRPSRPRRLPLYLAGAAVSSALIAAALFPIFNSGSASTKSASSPASSPTVISDSAAETQPTAPAITPPSGRAASAVSKAASDNGVVNAYAPPQAPSHSLVDRASPNPAPVGGSSLPGSPVVASVPSAGVPSAQRSISSVSAPPSVKTHAKPGKKKHIADDSEGVSVVVVDVERCAASIEQTVKQEGGAIILSAFTTHSDKTESAKLTVKIPAAQRAALLSQVAHCAENRTRSAVAGKSVHNPEPAPASPPFEPPADKAEESPTKQETAKKKVTEESDLIAVTIQLTGTKK